MTSKHVIRESESPRPAASSILISRMTRSSVIIPYINANVNSITEEISKLNRSRRSEISSGEHGRQSYQQSSTRAPPTKMFHRIPPVEAPQPPSSSPSTSSPSSSSPSSSSPSSSTSHRLARQEDASPDVITCTPPQPPETHKKQRNDK